MKRRTQAETEQDVEALRSMEIKALRARWREVMRTDPPLKVQSTFLRLAIAYRLQQSALGGLKPDALRRLRSYAKTINGNVAASQSESAPMRAIAFDAQTSLSPGTRLMREWNGTTELVDVVAGGFVWRGNVYKTLSATAVAITGTKWSGPKFFGLISPKAANSGHSSKTPPKPRVAEQAA